MRGGIERYLKTFPGGGNWKGKNFLFDKRLEQQPELKSAQALAADVESHCCLCKTPCAAYRGQHTCHEADCKVPVLVCCDCQGAAMANPASLLCPLCVAGYDLRGLEKPDLAGQLAMLAARGLAAAPMKRGREGNVVALVDANRVFARGDGGGRAGFKRARRPPAEPSTRLLLKRLPLAVSATAIRTALAGDPLDGGGVASVHWLMDRTSKNFYGSAYVQMQSQRGAERAFTAAASEKGTKLPGRRGKGFRIKLLFAPAPEGATWPPREHVEREYPPYGV